MDLGKGWAGSREAKVRPLTRRNGHRASVARVGLGVGRGVLEVVDDGGAGRGDGQGRHLSSLGRGCGDIAMALCQSIVCISGQVLYIA